MNIEEKQQYITYLEGLIAEQDKAVANGYPEKYINKNSRRHIKDKIEVLKASLNTEYPDQVDPADEDHIYFNADPNEKPA